MALRRKQRHVTKTERQTDATWYGGRPSDNYWVSHGQTAVNDNAEVAC